ncbi:MAG: CvpA family protein [Ferruginibacter sp.]
MFIDVVFILLMVWAIIKGLRKGLIVALFSFLAFFVGLAAALKLSTVVAARLGSASGESSRFLPLLSFILVFLAVAFLVSLAGRLLQKTFEVAMLGWANRIGGIIFYILLYSMTFSILLFYISQLHLISAETQSTSIFYGYLQPLAPAVMNALGKIIPFFSNMFTQLQGFFQQHSGKLQ